MNTSRQITKAYRRPRSRISFSWTTRHLKKLVGEFKSKYNKQSRHFTIIQLLDEFHLWSSCAPSYNAIAKKIEACEYLQTGVSRSGVKRNVSSAHAAAWICPCTRAPCPRTDTPRRTGQPHTSPRPGTCHRPRRSRPGRIRSTRSGPSVRRLRSCTAPPHSCRDRTVPRPRTLPHRPRRR